jgi:hydroxymethylpyrimidine pyrophosphatase-like HAD family hydrolase
LRYWRKCGARKEGPIITNIKLIATDLDDTLLRRDKTVSDHTAGIFGRLRECGVGIAVENATAECRQAANHICADCDSDGVARWIEENLL